MKNGDPRSGTRQYILLAFGRSEMTLQCRRERPQWRSRMPWLNHKTYLNRKERKVGERMFWRLHSEVQEAQLEHLHFASEPQAALTLNTCSSPSWHPLTLVSSSYPLLVHCYQWNSYTDKLNIWEQQGQNVVSSDTVQKTASGKCSEHSFILKDCWCWRHSSVTTQHRRCCPFVPIRHHQNCEECKEGVRCRGWSHNFLSRHEHRLLIYQLFDKGGVLELFYLLWYQLFLATAFKNFNDQGGKLQ